MSRMPSGKIRGSARESDVREVDYENDNGRETYHSTEVSQGEVKGKAKMEGGLGSHMGRGFGYIIAAVALFIIVWIVVWVIINAMDHRSFKRNNCDDVDQGKAIFASFVITIILFIIFWLIAYVVKSY